MMPADRKGLLLVLLQPAAFAAGAVLSRFVQWPTPFGDVTRPLVVLVVVAMAVFGLLSLASRNPPWAALATSAFVLLGMREALPGGVLASVAVWWLSVAALRRAGSRPPLSSRTIWSISRVSGVFALAYAGTMAASAWNADAAGRPDLNLLEYSLSGDERPNIYVVLLDGYPRADTLANTFDIDTSAFTDGLDELGFSVSERARANYPNTWLTMASMVNGQYVDDLLPRPMPEDANGQTRWLQSAIQEATVLQAFRDHGYSVRSVRTVFGSTALLRTEVLNDGTMTSFEITLLATSPWAWPVAGPLGETLTRSHADQIDRALGELAAQTNDDAPYLLFAHVFSPHTPFSLSFREGLTDVPDCFPNCSLWSPTIHELDMAVDEYGERLRAEIGELNERVLAAVTTIVDEDPDGIVILLSDHGIRYSFADYDEWFRTFFAARTPGAEGLFPEDTSPINVFRRLLAHYFGAQIDPLPYRSWAADWYAPLELVPRANPDTE